MRFTLVISLLTLLACGGSPIRATQAASGSRDGELIAATGADAFVVIAVRPTQWKQLVRQVGSTWFLMDAQSPFANKTLFHTVADLLGSRNEDFDFGADPNVASLMDELESHVDLTRPVLFAFDASNVSLGDALRAAWSQQALRPWQGRLIIPTERTAEVHRTVAAVFAAQRRFPCTATSADHFMCQELHYAVVDGAHHVSIEFSPLPISAQATGASVLAEPEPLLSHLLESGVAAGGFLRVSRFVAWSALSAAHSLSQVLRYGIDRTNGPSVKHYFLGEVASILREYVGARGLPAEVSSIAGYARIEAPGSIDLAMHLTDHGMGMLARARTDTSQSLETNGPMLRVRSHLDFSLLGGNEVGQRWRESERGGYGISATAPLSLAGFLARDVLESLHPPRITPTGSLTPWLFDGTYQRDPVAEATSLRARLAGAVFHAQVTRGTTHGDELPVSSLAATTATQAEEWAECDASAWSAFPQLIRTVTRNVDHAGAIEGCQRALQAITPSACEPADLARFRTLLATEVCVPSP